MGIAFTPAAERALVAAATWVGQAASDDLDTPELLLGLLSEPECRAAMILARLGVDSAAVQSQFGLRPSALAVHARPNMWSRGLHSALESAQQRLWDFPTPLVLATEHLLLGLVANSDDCARWLIERGFNPDQLEREIHQHYGHQRVETVASTSAELPRGNAADLGPAGNGSPMSTAPADATAAVKPAEPIPAAADDARADEISQRNCAGRANLREQTALYRIIDACANRAREGARTIEDYARFYLDDVHLTAQLKGLRHELASALGVFDTADLLACRDTLADVGTGLSTRQEQQRSNLDDVLAANFKRLQESLRSLEEYGKVARPEAFSSFKALRYRAYTLERALDRTRASRRRLAETRLYVLIDGRGTLDEFADLTRSLVEAGVHALQLRDKSLADRELISRARRLRQLTAGTPTLCIVNDRPDISALVGADGVHVGQEELTVKDARSIVGPNALVGVSTHSSGQARAAVLAGADYLGVGPTFPSGTKHFESFPGLELVRSVSAEISLPAFAIGGIDAANLHLVLAAGAGRAAVGAAVTRAADPAQAARELLKLLNSSP